MVYLISTGSGDGDAAQARGEARQRPRVLLLEVDGGRAVLELVLAHAARDVDEQDVARRRLGAALDGLVLGEAAAVALELGLDLLVGDLGRRGATAARRCSPWA